MGLFDISRVLFFEILRFSLIQADLPGQRETAHLAESGLVF